jgi:hypothetical protein
MAYTVDEAADWIFWAARLCRLTCDGSGIRSLR